MNSSKEKFIPYVTLATWRSAIKLEAKGLKHSRGSVTALAKRELAFKGTREKLILHISFLMAFIRGEVPDTTTETENKFIANQQ